MHEVSAWASKCPYTFEVISTEEGLAALKSDWNRLSACAENPNVFMTHSWFSAWTRRFARDEGGGRIHPHVLLIKQKETVMGLAPFVRRVVSRFGLPLNKLGFITYLSDYNDLVVGGNVRALTNAVMNYLAGSPRDWDLVDLTELRDDGSRIADMEAAAASTELPYRLFSEEDKCFYMPITAPWSRTRIEKHLRFARRAYAGLEERAGEGFRVRVTDQPQSEKGLLNRIIAVESQKLIDGRPLPPIIGKYHEVFQSLFDTLGSQGAVVIVLVEKNDELVAWRLLYHCGTKLWDHMTAYDYAYSDLSPGTALICAAIDYGFSHGCDELDFLRGMDAYKLRWTHEFRRNKRMILWNNRWVSKLYAALYLRHRVPASQEEYSSL
ncbi:MAG: GNAT family N-acetyltransferase [Terracidiphilus sp.]